MYRMHAKPISKAIYAFAILNPSSPCCNPPTSQEHPCLQSWSQSLHHNHNSSSLFVFRKYNVQVFLQIEVLVVRIPDNCSQILSVTVSIASSDSNKSSSPVGQFFQGA